MQHPCVHFMLYLPSATCAFHVPDMLQKHCEKQGKLPQPAVNLLVIANHAGLAQLWPQQPGIVMTKLTESLAAINVRGYSLGCLFDTPEQLPDLAIRVPTRFKMASHPDCASHQVFSESQALIAA